MRHSFSVGRAWPCRVRDVAMGVLAGLLAVVALPNAAESHTRVLKSEPAAGATLAAPPSKLRIQFSEAVTPALARLTLIGAGGDTIALSALRQEPGAPDVLEADVLGRAGTGGYRVEWRITGKDGHAVTGRIRFTVDSSAGAAAAAVDSAKPPEPSVSAPGAGTDTIAAERAVDSETLSASDTAASPAGASGGVSAGAVALKFLGYAGLLCVIGAAAFLFLVLPRVETAGGGAASPWLDEAAEQARRVGRTGAIALLVLAPVRLLAQVAAVTGGDPFDAAALRVIILETVWGHAWLLLLLSAVVAFVALRRGGPAVARPSAALLVSAAAGLAVAAALAGHAMRAERVPVAAAAAIDALHVAAAGMWVGALFVLVAAGMPAALRLPETDRGAAMRTLVTAFSTPALSGAALLALSGIATGWIQLGALSALGTTAYGQWLLRKLVVVALVLAAGAYNWRVVQPSLGTSQAAGRARRTASVEGLLMAVVLLLTAVLTSTPPPGGPLP